MCMYDGSDSLQCVEQQLRRTYGHGSWPSCHAHMWGWGKCLGAGRPAAAATATGYAKVHAKEQAALLSDALTL